MPIGNYRFDENLAVEIIEKILWIAVILVVTWALAKAAKWAFAKLVDNVSFFRNHNTSSGESVGHALGRVVALIVWLFGLVAVLRVLDLGEVMAPLQRLLDDVAGFIPNLIGAGIIFFIGLMLAKIVRDLTITALQTVDFDRWLSRGGAETMTGNPRISSTVGTIVYALIVIFFSIMALDVLDLAAVSEPASNMLEMIFNAIPNIIAAALLLGIGYLVSRFVVQILKEVLPGLGVDRALASAGFVPETTSASNIIARIAQVAIMLAFAIAATRALGFPEITALLGEILELGAKVIFGAVIIGVGFMLANLLARMIGDTEEPGLAGTIVKYATILLFTFMGLSFMGVGDDIVQLAFGALVIGGAVAAALAFGLGGREWAGRKLEQLDDKAREKSASSGSGSSGSPLGGSLGGSGGSSAGTTTTRVVRPSPPASQGEKPLPPGA